MEPSLLIAEDDAALRDVLVRSLRAEGFAARTVGSACSRPAAAPSKGLVARAFVAPAGATHTSVVELIP